MPKKKNLLLLFAISFCHPDQRVFATTIWSKTKYCIINRTPGRCFVLKIKVRYAGVWRRESAFLPSPYMPRGVAFTPVGSSVSPALEATDPLQVPCMCQCVKMGFDKACFLASSKVCWFQASFYISDSSCRLIVKRSKKCHLKDFWTKRIQNNILICVK